MSKVINLINKRFIRLVVVVRAANDKQGKARWLCLCDCGNYKVALGSHLRNGTTKSCGCLQREQRQIIGGHSRTHGMSRTLEYKIYTNMIQRCYNPNNPRYKNYGGRGIIVCARWLNSVEDFLKDIGKRPGPGYSIERMDNNGNYELGNWKWGTEFEQANNRRLSFRCKLFKAISPTNRVHINKNQCEFARRFNLTSYGINKCLKNRQGSHRGWKFTFLFS